jgi:MFS-type transporter involved in bile tolerance (Atg22 family)
LIGMILWGIGMGAQGSLLRSIVTEMIPADKRSTAFGLFDTGFGIAWFAGSWLMGIFYSKSIATVIIFSIATQLISLPIFVLARRGERR